MFDFSAIKLESQIPEKVKPLSLTEATSSLEYLGFDVIMESDSKKESVIDKIKKFFDDLWKIVTGFFKTIKNRIMKNSKVARDKVMEKKEEILNSEETGDIEIHSNLLGIKIDLTALSHNLNKITAVRSDVKMRGVGAKIGGVLDDEDSIIWRNIYQVFYIPIPGTNLSFPFNTKEAIDRVFGEVKKVDSSKIDKAKVIQIIDGFDKLDKDMDKVHVSFNKTLDKLKADVKKAASKDNTDLVSVFNMISRATNANLTSLGHIANLIAYYQTQMSILVSKLTN